ncbi:MAG TPA: hypothetical protein VNW49_02360 [Puia sp.]|jgi:hypothetical protein|nr:hypothetical protein [Puia sp.]
MKRIFIPVLTFFLAYACHSKQHEIPAGNSGHSDTAKKNYLPVADFLKAEIAAVDSLPLRLMKYTIVNGKTDSNIITTPVFDQIAKQFLMSDLDSSQFEKKYDENSFVDRSTNLVSFTYSTKDTGDGLKRVDVLLSPGAGSDKLNSIYMEAISSNADSSVISKMSWKAGRNFRILRIKKPKKGQEITNQTIVVWDSRD